MEIFTEPEEHIPYKVNLNESNQIKVSMFDYDGIIVDRHMIIIRVIITGKEW